MGIEHQLRRYIVYTCKKCGWQTAVLSQWADLKPKKCQNKKCRCLFLREPDQLDVKMPKEEKRPAVAPSALKKTKTTRKKTSGKKDDRQETGRKGRSSEKGRSKDGETSKS